MTPLHPQLVMITQTHSYSCFCFVSLHLQNQYEQNNGKCGVCGDPYQGPHDNEPGGRYANGIIVRKYEVGDVIEAVIELTASHKGYFMFKLCQNDDPTARVSHACFDRHVLRVAETNRVKYPIPSVIGGQMLRVKLQLPPNVRCKNCVLQWKYNAGNSWGTDAVTGRGCLGCGNQEQFYGCADIAIGHDVTISSHRPLPADTPDDVSDKKPIPHDNDDMYKDVGKEKAHVKENNINDDDEFSDFNGKPPHIPDWKLMEEREMEKLKEQFGGESASMTGTKSFTFLPDSSGKGMTPCMCVCQNKEASLQGGWNGALDLKVFQTTDDKLVCMCMCQNSSPTLRAVPATYFIWALVLLFVHIAFTKR